MLFFRFFSTFVRYGTHCNLPRVVRPFTRGHAALVDEALNLFDRVIIGIGNNTSKQGLLTVENRKRLIDDIYRGDERVEACIYTGLTANSPRRQEPAPSSAA